MEVAARNLDAAAVARVQRTGQAVDGVVHHRHALREVLDADGGGLIVISRAGMALLAVIERAIESRAKIFCDCLRHIPHRLARLLTQDA